MTCCGYNGSTVRKRLKQFGKLTSALASTLVLLLFAAVSQAFVITDVRVEGLQRISAGTVFGSIPYNVGDNVDDEGLRRIIRALFQTEYFDDVKVGRDGNVLLIIVKERPTIDSIEFEGNKAIKTISIRNNFYSGSNF